MQRLPRRVQDRVPDQQYLHHTQAIIVIPKRSGKLHCEHDRQRSKCKECGGSGICVHQRERNFCKDCGGSSICEHRRRRNECKECGGSSICEHLKHRITCIPCGGSSICEHRRRRSTCKDCGGASICEHQRRRSQCRDCGPRCALTVSVHQNEAVYGTYHAPADVVVSTDVRVASGDRLCPNCTHSLFPRQFRLKLRMEHLVLAELQARAGPESDYYHLTTWDCRVPCGTRAPDALWVWVRDHAAGRLSVLTPTEQQRAAAPVGHELQGWDVFDEDRMDVVAFQVVEVDEGGVDRHNTEKQKAKGGISHDEWLTKVRASLGNVACQVIRVGVAAHGVNYYPDLPPPEDLVCRRSKHDGETVYTVHNEQGFGDKMAAVLGLLADYREALMGGVPRGAVEQHTV